MKKLYSKKLGGEAFALDAAQLDTLKKAGYTVPVSYTHLTLPTN